MQPVGLDADEYRGSLVQVGDVMAEKGALNDQIDWVVGWIAGCAFGVGSLWEW
jgi:hypothetical protein